VPAEALPELASVHWRRRADDASLTRSGRLWTLHTVGYTAPHVAVAALLVALAPIAAPVALIAIAHGWLILELYAGRGAKVVRSRTAAHLAAERAARGLLADLLGHSERVVLEQTGLVVERGTLGTWVVGEEGALLVRPGGRRVHCFCARVTDQRLPSGDRIAHLLLALRADEAGFATLANLVFSGACWRLHRRLRVPGREALVEARRRNTAVGRVPSPELCT
jgi:hypothetical protein